MLSLIVRINRCAGHIYAAVILVLFFASNSSIAESPSSTDTTTLLLSSESVMTIAGSATIAGWSCTTNSAEGDFTLPIPRDELDKAYERILRFPADLQIQQDIIEDYIGKSSIETKLTIPVASFDCGNRMMESDMYEAIKANDFPEVHYWNFGVSVREPEDSFTDEDKENKDSISLVSSGVLGLAGVKNKVHINLSLTRLASGKYLISGTHPMKMSDYNITPPTALFGLIKASNDFSLSYELVAEVAPR